jgi:hypothetical protein
MRHNSDASRSTSSRCMAVSGVAIKGDSCFECLVVFDVFQSDNDGFGSQSVPNCISPRPPFASVSFRTCALECVASVGFDLSERGHWRARPTTVLPAELLVSMSGSRAVPAVPSWDTSVAVQCH